MKENELIPHLIKDTGTTVHLRRVSPLTLMEFGKQFPAPKPPRQKVDYGDGVERWEENPASPDYADELRKYQRDLAEKGNRFLLRMGVVIELTDEMKARVTELRTVYREETGAELPGDDKMVYLMHVAIGTGDDLNELIEAITQRSQATEAAIAASAATFPGNVSR